VLGEREPCLEGGVALAALWSRFNETVNDTIYVRTKGVHYKFVNVLAF
jgi:hypothetical protein